MEHYSIPVPICPTLHDGTHKQGNPRVRRCLYLAALSAIRSDTPFRTTYQRLLQSDKKPRVALAAIMRKLLVTMRAILISGKPFNQNHIGLQYA
ncbi:MAG TPA: hypothetical protein EYN96_09345 [Candidatus Hydrogenedentes bacterium]|nr:hypothetical protein [Candidatus Hydrogenedentota bacterium]